MSYSNKNHEMVVFSVYIDSNNFKMFLTSCYYTIMIQLKQLQVVDKERLMVKFKGSFMNSVHYQIQQVSRYKTPKPH